MHKGDRGLNALVASVLGIAAITIAAILLFIHATRDEAAASARPHPAQVSYWPVRHAPPHHAPQYITARALPQFGPQYGHFGAASGEGSPVDFDWIDLNSVPWPHRDGWPAHGADSPWRSLMPWLPWYAAGTVLCMFVLCFMAIGARRQARRLALAGRALCAQLAFDEALLDGIPHPVYARDNAGRLVGCNRAFEKLLGARPGQWIGTTLEAFAARHLSAETALAVREAYDGLLASQLPFGTDRTLLVGERRINVHHWAVPLSSPGHGITGLVAGFFDLTDRHSAGTEGAASLVPIAMISHEIRTPMNAVIGMLELLLHKNRLRGQARRYLATAHGSANSLLALINDVLDLSKIEAGKMEIHPEPVQLHAVVADVVHAFTAVAQTRKLRLRSTVSKLGAEAHLADPFRLRQILGNLISNAIKFSEHGEITVSLESLGQQDGSDSLRLTVTDQGIGIDAEDIPRLFEPFFRAAASRAVGASGTGLGLPICRRLARQMGGELEIASTRGSGTVATLTLSLAGTAPNTATLAPPCDQPSETAMPRGFRVLLADDHDPSRLLLQQQLAHLGIEATPANDGAHALALWFASSKSFDLLITDCNMPKVNGFEMAGELRRQERARGWPRRPILGYSADVHPDNHAQALEAGMDDCLGKPLVLDSLRQALRQLLPMAQKQAPLLSCADGPGVEGRFLDVLLASNEADMAAIVPAVAASDWSQAGSLAHRLKGAARLDSASAVARCCEALEAACAAGDATAANTALPLLQHAMAEWTENLQARRARLPTS